MRNRYVLLADLAIFALAACAAFGLRFDWYFFQNRPEFLPYALAAPLVKSAVFYAFGMYRRYWRYATTEDLVALAIASSAASIPMAVLVSGALLFHLIAEFSRSVLVADWLFTLVGTGAVRMSVRVIGEARGRRNLANSNEQTKRVLIVGAGDAGAIVTREMRRNPQLGMEPVAFVDDDPVKRGKRIYGVPVAGGLQDLPSLVESLNADEVVIAMPKSDGRVLRSVAEQCRRIGIASRTIPGIFELLGGGVSVSRLRQVDITDLLRRRPVEGNSGVSAYVRGREVLVTGAGGSIGFELCRQIAHSGARGLVLLGHGENSIFEAQMQLRQSFPGVRVEPVIADVRDRDRLLRLFERIRPDVVFHAAAHKHVPLMEENPEEAVSNNVVGTQNVIDACAQVGTDRVVLISSDKAVNPVSLMGASKRVAEAIVREAARATRRPFVVVRFGNVLGSRGSVVQTFKKQIADGGPIYVTHPDMKRFFMTIPEAVHLVLQAAGIGKGGELFVLKMGPPLRIVDLAEDLIRLSGLSPEEIPIVFTGVRAGEKLEEALWEEGAVLENTEHPDIVRVSEPHADIPIRLAPLVEGLARAAAMGDAPAIDRAFRQVIPSFSRTARVARAETFQSQGQSLRAEAGRS